MDYLQPLAAIGFVMLLLGGTLTVLKKRGAATPFRAGKRLAAIERLSLGQHHALHLVQMDGRTMLVATGPGSVQVICNAEAGAN